MKKKGKDDSCPRICNTGAQNTCKSWLRSLIDWVGVTLKKIDERVLIEEILKLNFDDFIEMRGGHGYKKSLRLGNITVYFDGHEDMGIHLQMSGQGCREYEGYKRRSWSVLFLLLLDLEANFARLDLATDDFFGFFKISELERKTKNGELVSKFKEATNYEKIRLKDGYVKGQTLYFGSPQSLVMVRFYDKYKEKKSKGLEDELDGVDFWNRVEIQLKNDRAAKVAWLIGMEQDVGKIVAGVLFQYMRFLVRGKDSNKSRWKTWKKWEKFIGDVEKIKLTEDPCERTIDMSVGWVKRQVTPTLAAIMKAESEEFLINLIKEAEGRLKEKDYLMIDRYKKIKSEMIRKQAVLYDPDAERAVEMWKLKRRIALKLQGVDKIKSSMSKIIEGQSKDI